ncbi:hypothetical protein FRB90_008439, partial [Tulasnella sp. 427]
MSSKVQLDDIVDITYTAAPKSGGLSLSKAELTRAFNLRQITISTDPLTRNQWVSLWAKGTATISEKILVPSESLPPLDDSRVTPPIAANIAVHASPKVLTSPQAAPRSPPLPKFSP